MRAPGRLALLLVATATLAGCGENGRDPAPPTPAATPHIPPTAIEAEPTGTPAADTPVIRSLRLSGSGWQFDLDTATVGDATRIDVLVLTATVGAAPQRLRLDVVGGLAEAFATDLDGDSAPELLLWTRSGGSSAEGDVRGWRFDAAGGATAIQAPTLDDEAAIGWRGRDQFGVQGDALVRSFPLYRDDDDNASPSAGFVRVIRYRLVAEGLAVAETTLEPMDGTPQADVLAR
jgi:hypothetical protein